MAVQSLDRAEGTVYKGVVVSRVALTKNIQLRYQGITWAVCLGLSWIGLPDLVP